MNVKIRTLISRSNTITSFLSHKFFVFFFFSLLLLPYACKKEKEINTPVVLVSPNDLHIYAHVDDVVSLTIKVKTDVELNRFVITSKLDNTYQVTELDSSLPHYNSFDMEYEYKIPISSASKSIVITFIAYNVNGEKGTAAKRIMVYPVSSTKPRLLIETSGHQMYSKFSKKMDAYNLETGTPEYSTLADSSDKDIEDYPENDTMQTISKTWLSPAGGKFVKFNDYNYANATDSTLIAAYNSGIKLDQVNEIKAGDIYLMKLSSLSDTIHYVVVKVMAINDDIFTDNDFYLFNLKK